MLDRHIDTSFLTFRTLSRMIITGAVLLGLGAFIPLCIASYLQHEDPAYLWDWGGYFDMYRNFGNMICNNDHWFQRLLVTIDNDDYNLLPVSFLAPFYSVFQDSRFGYICGISLFYLIPTAFIATLCTTSSIFYDTKTSINRITKPVFLCVFAFFSIFHPFWAPTLRGLPDIVGLIPLGLATLLLIRSTFLTQASWRTLICFSILTWLPFALRRWYAFSIVVMLALSAFIALIYAFQCENRKKALLHVVKAYGLCGSLTGIFLIYFQHDLVFKILGASYRDAYAGYQEPFIFQLHYLYETAGPFYTFLFLLGVGLALRKKNTPVLFCASAAVLTFLLFSRTQAPGIQHVLPIFFWMAIAGGYAVLEITYAVSALGQKTFAIALLIYGALASAVVFFPQADNHLKMSFPVFPKERISPLHMENMPEYNKLLAQLKELTKNGDHFAVFASSGVLADALLYAFDHSLEKNLVWTSQVDARDHLRLDALEAPLAIVTDPPVTHLNNGTQQVITLPDDCIFHQHDFGTAYQRIAGPFFIAEGHKAYIYRRTRPLSDADIEWTQAQLNHSYPAWKWNHAGMIE